MIVAQYNINIKVALTGFIRDQFCLNLFGKFDLLKLTDFGKIGLGKNSSEILVYFFYNIQLLLQIVKQLHKTDGFFAQSSLPLP